MFFVRKDNIATQLGTQKEFAACERRGIGFFAAPTDVPGHFIWHYLWPADRIEPSIRESIEAAAPTPPPQVRDEDAEFDSENAAADPAPVRSYIWSQEVAPGTLVGEPLISVCVNPAEFRAEAERLWAAQPPTTD